jgi:hypothetical protein
VFAFFSAASLIAVFLPARSVFFSINSDDFAATQVSIFKERNKEFEQILTQRILLSKVGYAMVVGFIGACHGNSIGERTFHFEIRRPFRYPYK